MLKGLLPILFSSSLNPLKSAIKKSDAWHISGMEKESGKPIDVLFIGEEKTKYYITELLYKDIFHEIVLHQKTKLSLFLYCIKQKNILNIVFINAKSDLFKKSNHKNYFSIPEWVNCTAIIPFDESSESIKSDIRKVRKYRLNYRITDSHEDVIYFYNEMLVPYMHARHSKRAYPIELIKILEKIDKGQCKLLLVEWDNEPVSGVLLILENNKSPILWRNGLKSGNIDYWKMGAIFATYYFASHYLLSLGHKSVNLGNSRCFLSDGVLNYKRKLNISIKSSSKKKILVLPVKITESVISFFKSNPFIYHKNNKSLAAGFFDSTALQSDLKKQIKPFTGISEVCLFSIINNKILIQKSTNP
ncbi:hypothetical protein Clim_0274 [Chlorobium limicola DSM 245]|uniref:BioF2-like acetyltransferase domain-containing protein n=1 Tax=Chlorobium limicola (strain DSM 245 / NBRC 103803 / 6330) TaxID=290315 RepID=B3EEY6_CHLL2|nr:hypothetical protein [Chlorobium limicola]ACD89369.1 hypothetical protein Clim_0274 [Chlorobium limicola DSM 245]